MKNNGIWNEKIHDTRPADHDVCPKTTSSMPKPRSESSAASLEYNLLIYFLFFTKTQYIIIQALFKNFVEAKFHTVIKLPASQSKSIATNGHINLSYSEMVW